MGGEWEPAAAKVNLYLHVTGRRANGYHELDSLAIFAPGDRLVAEPADTLSLTLEGPFAAALADDEDDNLVLRAARVLAAIHEIEPQARLVLEKNLPVASGIGGGSADAAACLRALARLWRVSASPVLAAGLGADVPVCLAGRPARMLGIGEVLVNAPALPLFGLALANPGVPVATSAVFAARTGGFSPPAILPDAWYDAAAMARDLAVLGNDLETPAIALCPVIAEVLAAMRAQPGCLLARMSGSGATCFGMFATHAEAERAAAALPAPWWRWGGAPYW